jgi:hypothetical protein
MLVFVLNKHGRPLMPCKPRKARILLKEGKAKIVQHEPFTIQLKYGSWGITQDIKLGIDPGAKHIGVCAKSDKEILFVAEIELRSREVTKNMQNRAMHRVARKRHKRDKRQRRAKQAGTIFTEKQYQFPGYEKTITAKLIKPALCKFLNRKNDRHLTPTANHMLESHKNIVRKIKKILPITEVVLEYCSFDIHKLKNPEVSGIGYQNGTMKGSTNFTDYILTRDKHTCQKCKKKKNVKLQVHHIRKRSDGGTDVPSNGLTLCEKCHEWTHKNEKNYLWIQKKFGSLDNRFFQPTSLLNIIMPGFTKWLHEEFNQAVSLTFGYENKDKRRKWNLDKRHWIDAFCCVSEESLLVEPNVYQYKQFRRHNRANIHAQIERNYYLDRKKVATNRNSRTGQVLDSLKDLVTKQGIFILNKLTAKKGYRRYRSIKLFNMGDIVLFGKKRQVVKGYTGTLLGFINQPKYSFPMKQTDLILKNQGIVCTN